uniref:Histone-lysine N-methyltransferase NSD3 n=1 Tax=Oryzias melastigma TaxID=30732 RepID=A0A3B3DR07_ORYME
MDFSFSFMQGIMGNTIQQPPQLIDSANIRQDGTCDTGSDPGEDSGPSYDASLDAEFPYPPSASEVMPQVPNGYPPSLGLYEPQTKFSMYSQFPNGSANGYGAIRSYGEHGLLPGEGTVLRGPGLQERPLSPVSPPFTPSSQPAHIPSNTPGGVLKKTSSPEIKLKIIKTYQNGKELFESALCGDLLQELQKNEAVLKQRRHERKKEKRKRSARLQAQEQNQDPSPAPVGTTEPPEETQVSKVHHPSVIQETGICKEFVIGDLVWSKVGTYPWWPCMVSSDPQMKVHTRINTRGHREYHVQFFGSVAERAWIHEKRIVVYQGKQQFDELQAETLRKATNPVERQKLLKPIPQRERSQWEVGVGHAEDAFLMTRQERIDNYTFIYVDPDPNEPQQSKKPTIRPEKRNRRCSVTNAEDSSQASAEERSQKAEQRKASSPRLNAGSETQSQQDTSPPVRAWKTAAARKLLPLSITMKRLNVEITKCDWPLLQKKPPLSPKRGNAEEKEERVEREARQPDLGSPASQRSEEGGNQQTSSPGSQDSSPQGSQERKLQRRSIRSKSESERGNDPVPKKKTKKEQAEMAPETTLKTGSQKGTSSEISDACKPLKKRSRASTDVEMASSQYRDTSDSDSRGLSDPQGLFGKSLDSPAAADADASDTQSVDSGLSRQDSSNEKRDTVCQICETYGEGLMVCEGDCSRQFHLECLGLSAPPDGRFTCLECKNSNHPCFSCKTTGQEVTRCSAPGCSCYYHEDCVWKLSGTTSSPGGGFCCPQHSCSTCCLERDLQRASKGGAFNDPPRCLSQTPAGENKALNQERTEKKKERSLNVNLLCCDSCPASFHPECLEMEMPEGAWSCSDCRAGKKPHYKQIVWVKLGNYRWWPAEICNPRLVPSNIQSLRHDIGDFPVFFFGSHDYYWINQGRVFPYVENDKNFVTGQININKTFKKALEEAARRFQELKAQRESREALEQERNSRKPPPYKLIKSNKPVGKVQMHVADLSEIPRCNCKPGDERPCSIDSQCLNRMLQYECHPQVCPAGENCENQNFTKRLYAETEVMKTEGRGWGLRTNQTLRKGDFVAEYVGEVIDSEECQQRIKRAHENHVTNFYMLTLTKDRVIDAGPKGNSSRFINHSCNPNCETQKWTVNGDVRIGIFALCDEKSTAASEKARNAKLKPKKRKLRLEGKHTHEYFCFCCGDGGELVMCDRKDCPKAYHLLCLNLTKPPYGRWECPWHDCSVCGSPASSHCDFCPRSFCTDHEAGALTPSSLDDRPCCSSHNPLSPLGSGSSQRHGAALSPVRVKEEPEGERAAAE